MMCACPHSVPIEFLVDLCLRHAFPRRKAAKIGKNEGFYVRVYAFFGACGAGGGGRNADHGIKTSLVYRLTRVLLYRGASFCEYHVGAPTQTRGGRRPPR